MTTSAPRDKRLPNPYRMVEDQFAIGVQLLGQVLILWFQTLSYMVRGQIDLKETVRQAYMIGVLSFVVVGITALFTGFAMSLQIS